MEAQGNRRPRTPLKQQFNKVGTFTQLPDGTVVPELPETSKEEDRQP
jgi:hypothetical protein